MLELTHKKLKEVIVYDQETGEFIWAKTVSSRALVGKTAGRIWNGQYRRITIDKVDYQAHRLAWFYVTRTWPVGEIDHINRNKSDNRIVNLRCAGRSGNQQNKGVQQNNKSGYPGVYWHKRDLKWVAAIRCNGKRISLGSYSTPEAAHITYLAAKRNLHPGCTI
jgi:hypothetical protein